MRATTLGCVMLSLAVPSSTVIGAQYETVKLTGYQYRAIETAVRTQRTNKLSVERYEILVGSSPGFWIIQFRDPIKDPKRVGGSARMPEFDVTIRAEKYEVVSVHGIK